MSQQLGRILTCDRCGKTVFKPVREPKGDKGWSNDILYFECAKVWVEPRSYDLKLGAPNAHRTLCPECEATRNDVMNKFWSNEQVLKHKFQVIGLIMNIKGLMFDQTCPACPEQYDVINGRGQLVGYVRLRYGCLICDYFNVRGEEIYRAYIGDSWTGCFTS